MERAWIFILLLAATRNRCGPGGTAGGVAIAIKPGEGSGPGRGLRGRSRPIGMSRGAWPYLSRRQLYLFDPRLGLPIPASDGHPGRGSRAARCSTCHAGTGGDPNRSLLDRLDLDARHPYWAKSADFKQLIVAVEGSPIYLSKPGKAAGVAPGGKTENGAQQRCDGPGKAARLGGSRPPRSAPLELCRIKRFTARSQLGTGGSLPPAWTPCGHWFALNSTPLFKGRVLHLKGRFQDSERSHPVLPGGPAN